MTNANGTTVDGFDDPHAIVKLLRVQASLYAKLESVATRQRTLVTEDDIGPLLSLLADRRKLSEKMAELGQTLQPIRANWPAFRETLAPDDRDEAERLLAETKERLKRMIEADEHDARVLSVRKQAVARTLRATHTTSQAVSAYRSSAGRPVRFDCVNEDS
ncbi:MAG: flagellar export chaperone FlgN [Phycisphaerae bacterium]|jgi:hypothetical protein